MQRLWAGPIESIVRAIGVGHVEMIRPFRIKKSIEAVRKAIDFEGVSVIIAQEICPLYAKGLKKLWENLFM
jgi:indolepyruvate ferredoxin oxidoreductase, alpha subunit